MAEWDLTPRKASDSEVELAQLMTIVDANNVGNVHGGTIMKLVDTAGALAALRHGRRRVVTVEMDSMRFHEPVHVGNLLTLSARVTAAGSRMSPTINSTSRFRYAGRFRPDP